MSYTKGEWGTELLGTTLRMVDEKNNDITLFPGYSGLDIANAKRITQCVNSHDDLMEVCKDLISFINYKANTHGFDPTKDARYRQAQQSIQKAEVKQ